MKIISDISCLGYERAGHPESPTRVSGIVTRLQSQSDLALEWMKPEPAGDDSLWFAHDQEHVDHLDREIDFDPDTPAHPGIELHARRAVGGALLAMDQARAGETAMSILRPPGHHATRASAMGFCYLNQVATCALVAAEEGLRVAVYDFDVHHGNGTEDILFGRAGTGFFSVHQWPCFPGTGRHHRQNCMNWPVVPGARRAEYRDALWRAFDEMLAFAPDILCVSAGFDAYRGDPLAQENLEAEDYEAIGRRLLQSGIPTFAVLEGGYSRDLPDLVMAFLKGLSPSSS